MTIPELQRILKNAYNTKNLNNISLTLINLYKNQQFSILKKIAEIISDFVDIEINDDGKGFSKLIMLYHPDRAHYHLNEIDKIVEQNDFDKLLTYSHILKLERIEEIAATLDRYEDIDYSPVYEWDVNYEAFQIKKDWDKEKRTKTKARNYNFYSAIKMRQYGSLKIEFPSYYLEDIEEFELSASDINDLDGIQFCIHATTIDLSDNHISDISLLEGLTLLEELNLTDNLIENIDTLSNLINLKRILLANNSVEDISALFELDKLEYADLTGNKISENQISLLLDLGVSVDF